MIIENNSPSCPPGSSPCDTSTFQSTTSSPTFTNTKAPNENQDIKPPLSNATSTFETKQNFDTSTSTSNDGCVAKDVTCGASIDTLYEFTNTSEEALDESVAASMDTHDSTTEAVNTNMSTHAISTSVTMDSQDDFMIEKNAEVTHVIETSTLPLSEINVENVNTNEGRISFLSSPTQGLTRFLR